MFDLSGNVQKVIDAFFANFFEDLISTFGNTLADIMSASVNVLKMPYVQKGIIYSQLLAAALLIIFSLKNIIGTYILHRNGDPDADPSGLLLGMIISVATIFSIPWILHFIFTFGTKLAVDVANLGTGKTGADDWEFITQLVINTAGLVIILFGLFVIICFIVIAVQANIRGGKLVLLALLGAVMAINLSSTNTSTWNSWLKEVIIVCSTQALQIFMLQGALALSTSQALSSGGMLVIIGWLWVTMSTPKYIKQYTYSTGIGGAISGGVRQAGSMAIMRKMMR